MLGQTSYISGRRVGFHKHVFSNPGMSELRPLILLNLQATMRGGFRNPANRNGSHNNVGSSDPSRLSLFNEQANPFLDVRLSWCQ